MAGGVVEGGIRYATAPPLCRSTFSNRIVATLRPQPLRPRSEMSLETGDDSLPARFCRMAGAGIPSGSGGARPPLMSPAAPARAVALGKGPTILLIRSICGRAALTRSSNAHAERQGGGGCYLARASPL